MRAIVIDRFGSTEVLRVGELATPRPGPGELLIKVACAGVNPADWKCREGMLARFNTYSFPFVLGFDAAGTVAEVGPGVTAVEVGDRVYTASNQGEGEWGSYAEYVKVSVDVVAPMPNNLDFAQAAAVPLAALTAWQGLFDNGGLTAGQKVLVHGGSGGLGSFAVQFAKAAGADVATTCGTANLAYVTGLGADRAIDSRTEDVPSVLRQWAPEGVDLVLDAVGGATLPRGLELLKPGGTLVSVPTLMSNDGPDPAEAARRGIRTVLTYTNMSVAREQLRRIAELFERGRVRVPEITIYPLEQVGRAHELSQSGRARGKLVLQVA